MNDECDYNTLRSEAQVMSKFRKLNECLVKHVKSWNNRFSKLIYQIKKGEEHQIAEAIRQLLEQCDKRWCDLE